MAEVTNKKTQIRQADNSVKIEGIVREINLEEKDDVISGDVIISTGGNSEHAVSVYISRLTKANIENRAYKGIKTVMKDYASIASLLKEGKTLEEAASLATKVRIGSGSLGRNEFYANDELVSRPRISSNFFNRIEDDSFEPKAEFEVECYFEKIRKEIKNNEETGRLIIEAILPVYGGLVVPMEFIAADDIADYMEQNYEAKKTGRIWGDIVNIAERILTKKSGFGKDKEDIKTNFTREFVITGGEEETYDEDSEKAYTIDQIKEAWKVRETESLPRLLQKSKENGKAKGGKNKTAGSAPGFKF
jgi:hypothetical protein